MPFSLKFSQNIWSDNVQVLLNAKKFPLEYRLEKYKTMKLVCEQYSILEVRVKKFGSLREPIRMLLFVMD